MDRTTHNTLKLADLPGAEECRRIVEGRPPAAARVTRRDAIRQVGLVFSVVVDLAVERITGQCHDTKN